MKLIIFDCDGTIADSQHMILAAMERSFEAHDLAPPDRAQVVGVIGLSLEQAISNLLSDADSYPDLITNLTEGYKRAFQTLRSDPSHVEPLFDGAHNVLKSLSARDDVVLGMATGKSTRGVIRLLERENLMPYFATIQTADEHPSKPHPSMIVTAMNEVGAKAHDTLMIGDTTFDIDMAKAANAGSIGVTWGYHPKNDLQDARPDALVDTFDALPKAIIAIWEKRSESVA